MQFMKQVFPKLMSPLRPIKEVLEILRSFLLEGEVDLVPGEESPSDNVGERSL